MRTFSFLVLITAAFTFCLCPLAAEEKVKIGVVLPLTGDMSAVGAACRDAVRLALDDAPPAVRSRYEIIFEDDRLTPNEVAKAAHKLIAVDRVSALISTWSYGGRIVSPLVEKARIPHIGVAWDQRVADGGFNFLHLTPPSEFMRGFLEVFKRIGVKRVALLSVEESGSVFAMDEFERMAPAYGVEVVYRDAVLWDLNDFNSFVSKIAAVKPDYLLFNLGGLALNSRMLRSLKMQRVGFKFTAITSFDVIEDTSQIEGLWYVSDSYLPDDFTERFRSKYGHELRYGVGNFYEAVRLLIHAFERTQDRLPAQAQEQLLMIKDFPSVLGPTSADANGIFTYPARYIRITGGKRVPINLADIKE